MTLSSANKIYLYDGDAKFIKEQVGNGYDNLTAAGVVHELIESYKQSELQKMIAAINWHLSSLTGLSSDLAWQGQRNNRLYGGMSREEFENSSSSLPKMDEPLKEQK